MIDLRRREDDGVSCMYPQRIKILHVTNGDAIVIPITHHLEERRRKGGGWGC